MYTGSLDLWNDGSTQVNYLGQRIFGVHFQIRNIRFIPSGYEALEVIRYNELDPPTSDFPLPKNWFMQGFHFPEQ